MRLSGVLSESFLRCMSDADRKALAPNQLTIAEARERYVATTERQLQGWLVGLLRLRDIAVLWHRTDKKSAATLGWPDLTFSIAGRAIAWECKLTNEHPTAEQVQCHIQMTRNGWTVEIVRSVEQGLILLKSYERDLYNGGTAAR